ncbi:hypothetical protein [Catellatospora sichuanensis]|uniref:hypothetical protein n=1 Tax=Catellatospora sichuanensis TaxID=1969805 RepID=UPI001182094B|nr:hypothetical protein [Catellatospora sichuanensis]
MEERLSDDSMTDWRATVPTLALPAVTALNSLMTRYVSEFASPDARGQVVFLYGEHGSGKTHAVRYALSQFSTSPDGPQPLRCYVKAQDQDFPGTYRRLMGQLSRADLRELSLGFLAAIAAEQASPRISAQDLRRDPDLVYALLDGYLVERGAVLEAQAAELSTVAGGREDFQRALTFLLDDQLAGAAYDWLVGNAVNQLDARRLGVHGPITEPEMCRYGIQLLVQMCVRTGRPIVVVFDQCERLLLDEQHHLRMPNVGLLHSLVEAVPQAGGMLVLVGSTTLWGQLPVDLRQRIGVNHIATGLLTVGNASQLLELYINAVTGNAGCHPFTLEAVRALLAASGGNIRRLLQVSFEAFEDAALERDLVDASTIRRVAEGKRALLGRGDAEQAVEHLLLNVNVPFIKDWHRGRAKAAYAVEAEGTPRLLIHVTEALFSDDEVANALHSLALVEHVHRNRWSARVVVLVVGYVSPDVFTSLSQVAHDVIVFTGAPSVEILRPVVANLRTMAASPVDTSQLHEIQQTLRALAASRDEEVSQLRREVARLSAGQVRADGGGTIRSRWAERRLQLVERIRVERELRRAKELGELRMLHDTAIRDRRVQTATFGGLAVTFVLLVAWLLTLVNRQGAFVIGTVLIGVGLVSVLSIPWYTRYRRAAGTPTQRLAIPISGISVIAVGTALFSNSSSSYSSYGTSFANLIAATTVSLIAVAFVVVAIALLDVSGDLLIGSRRLLRGPTDSLQRLHLTAQAAVQRLPRVSHRSVSAMLADPDPHVRYAGVLCAARARMDTEIVDLIVREPSSLIRRVAATHLAFESRPEIARAVQDIAERYRLTEIAYYAAATADPDAFDGAAHLQLVSLLSMTPQTADVRRRTLHLLLAGSSDEAVEAIAALTLGGLEPTVHVSQILSGREIFHALRTLSPLEPNGLGTFDELPSVNEIDDWYLCFEQLAFYRNAGPDSWLMPSTGPALV